MTRLLLPSVKRSLCVYYTAEILIDTDEMQQQQQQPSHRVLEATRSVNTSSSPTQSAASGAGRPLARQDHVRGSAESLVTKVR